MRQTITEGIMLPKKRKFNLDSYDNYSEASGSGGSGGGGGSVGGGSQQHQQQPQGRSDPETTPSLSPTDVNDVERNSESNSSGGHQHPPPTESNDRSVFRFFLSHFSPS